jgi:signal peptidase II
MRISSSTFVTRVTLISIFLLALFDQITKILAEIYLDPLDPVKLIPGHLHLALVYNPGAAFGLMRTWAAPWRIILFTVMYGLAFIILVNMYIRRPSGNRLIPLAICLIGGGAIGNLIDRYRFGYVVDFIDTYPFGYHFPTFNFADTFISTGVTLMIIYMLFFDRESANVP